MQINGNVAGKKRRCRRCAIHRRLDDLHRLLGRLRLLYPKLGYGNNLSPDPRRPHSDFLASLPLRALFRGTGKKVLSAEIEVIVIVQIRKFLNECRTLVIRLIISYSLL